MQFLASSITFMVNITKVEVFVDEHSIGSIEKGKGGTGLPGDVDIPGELMCSSPSGIMDVTKIQRHRESDLWVCCVAADDYI